jgi:hypothetical protein
MARITVPSQRVPTLTEVVNLAASPPAATDELPSRPVPLVALPTEAQLTQRVLVDLERQVDLVLDYRLREVLSPILSRLAESLVRDVRKELALSLHELVARAVAQELSRHRDR